MLPNHQRYINRKFISRFIKHRDVEGELNRLPDVFTVEPLGQSAQGSKIYCVSTGTGPKKVLLWSQMHGNEATATLALLDLFNFFGADGDADALLRTTILRAFTLYFVPMLNPDGAEVLERRNAQGIDINRDFLAQQSPEGKILANLQERIKPDFAFNLHDQDSLWSVAGTKKPATISLLAPPADADATLTPTRLRAMQIIAGINTLLQEQVPGHVGRWNEDFEPRAFGDNFQRLDTATILIEAGGWYDDAERQFARKLNFDAILHGLQLIAKGVYAYESIDGYYAIPENSKNTFHLLIKNCVLETATGHINCDIGLNYVEQPDFLMQDITRIYFVADVGDLSTWDAYETLDAKGLNIIGEVKIDSPPTFELRIPGNLLYFESGLIVNKNN